MPMPPAPAIRKKGLPLHHQLYVVLRDQILRGLHPPGSQLPNETRLGELFEVSRITVRRALGDLDAEGLVERRQGFGTFVRANLPSPRPAATLGFLELLKLQAESTEVKVLAVDVQDPPAAVALQLQLAAGDQAVHAVRLRSANGVALMLIDAWVPLKLGATLTREKLRRRALYEVLLAQGVKFGRVVQEITAVAADPHLALLLATEVGAPLLRMTRLLYAQDLQPLLHTTIHVCPERSRILMDVDIESMNTLSAGQIAHDVR